MNIRHDLDPVLVAEQIERKCAEHDRQRKEQMVKADKNWIDYNASVADGTVARKWVRAPDTAASIDEMYHRWIRYEREVYAKVRIIELPIKAKKKFILVYGDTDDATVTHGTGPTESIEKSTEWFMRGGR